MDLVFTREAVRRIDAEAIEQYGIAGLDLMENAARGATEVACSMLADGGGPAHVLVACGRGNNGGDGWAMARMLLEQGHLPHVVHLGAPASGSDAGINMDRAHEVQVPSVAYQQGRDLHRLPEPGLIIDALFGTGLDRELEGPVLELVKHINDLTAPILAIDLPSGLDADTGQPRGEAVQATATVTFVGRKLGFTAPGAAAWTGEVHVIDIGVPGILLEKHGMPVAD